ncbi:MAG TPA: TolC family protein [Gemmatimonadales bacterium]|nr:TolC family protein [Gemmatimonadales bacterium]
MTLAWLGLAFGLAGDTLPSISLREALERAARLDPAYVNALGQVDNAAWARRAARLAFVLPALEVGVDATTYSSPVLNPGTGLLRTSAVTTHVGASYELLSVRKIADLTGTEAGHEAAAAGELAQRFQTAMATEADYYSVLASQELLRVATERLNRAREQLAVARARVLHGVAVQSDSLQVALEETRAEIDSAQSAVTLAVARLQLGRRVGAAGPVAAEPLDTLPAPELPLSLDETVALALHEGPRFRLARANERAATALLAGTRGTYLPELTLGAANDRFDSHFYPEARSLSSLTLRVSLPLWTGGARELAISEARVQRDVARAVREDTERAARRDVTEAYRTYTTARDNSALAIKALATAAENFRVQDQRYRAGATTILDLVNAQVQLTQAGSDVVATRYATRLALAGLEAILGRRLFR